MNHRQFNRVHGKVREYEVFARKLRIEPLRQIGSVLAPDDDLAAAYARATYDEERWVEMAIVPRDSMTTLWGPGHPPQEPGFVGAPEEGE
jgi:1,2-phenylacetyl-CoA epoxidase PaaB subunit